MSAPLITPRDLADIVIDEARKQGIAQAEALNAEAIARVLFAAGQRAVGSAVQRGAGNLIRGLAEAAAASVERRRGA